MKTETSKVTTKYQATIPESVRTILHLDSGDEIVFEIDDKGVRLRKAGSANLAFAKALEDTVNDWGSEADEKAYRGL